ncbi:DUF6503 family protein [Patiriisocius hiemis]|uniref:DUF6503 family protein n=1 Tax=Patiriisocius hiemis TaxID=3075604 RepID=A0ABU2Y8Q3_9FLAO|nr:DUF6503 family protein [Constantimarinum sp. W242]MDT0554557.1 DUF6503 family protein [Constantimarinum sp. W242]
MRLLLLLITVLFILSCKESSKKLTAQDIIDNAIDVHCNDNCEDAFISFTFRDKEYKSIRKAGKYQYERIFSDSIGIIKDVITNEGYRRYINDSVIKVVDSMATKYANSVNSVHYFSQLPYGLNAPAVKKELLGEATIKGKEYYEIGITFTEEGGGTDFEDEFVYWIEKEDFSLDYLAYSYTVNGGGIRFREAFNKRVVNGITFLDYNNYKPESLDIKLTTLDSLFENEELVLLSKIENEQIEVSIN